MYCRAEGKVLLMLIWQAGKSRERGERKERTAFWGIPFPVWLTALKRTWGPLNRCQTEKTRKRVGSMGSCGVSHWMLKSPAGIGWEKFCLRVCLELPAKWKALCARWKSLGWGWKAITKTEQTAIKIRSVHRWIFERLVETFSSCSRSFRVNKEKGEKSFNFLQEKVEERFSLPRCLLLFRCEFSVCLRKVSSGKEKA